MQQIPPRTFDKIFQGCFLLFKRRLEKAPTRKITFRIDQLNTCDGGRIPKPIFYQEVQKIFDSHPTNCTWPAPFDQYFSLSKATNSHTIQIQIRSSFSNFLGPRPPAGRLSQNDRGSKNKEGIEFPFSQKTRPWHKLCTSLLYISPVFFQKRL